MIKNLLSTRLALLEFIIIGAIFWYQKFLVFGHDSHKCQSCHGLVLCNIFSCLGSCLVSCPFLSSVLSCFVLFLRCVLLSWLVFNLVPRSLITKAKAGSGQVRKFIFFSLGRLWANDANVVSCARYGVRTKGHSLQSFQFCSKTYFHWKSSFPSQYKL